MPTIEDIRQHPKFLALSPSEQELVTRKYIDQEWSKFQNHPKFVSLDDTDKERVRSGFMERYYGDALEPVEQQETKQRQPLLEGLTPATEKIDVNSVNPNDYPEIGIKPKPVPEKVGPEIVDDSRRSRPIPEFTQGKGKEHYFEAPPEPERTVTGTAKDLAITATKGAISVGEAVQGLIDIPTGGHFGYLTEKLGYKPKAAKEILDTFYSEAQKNANKQVNDAYGFTGTLKKLAQYPSVVAHSTIESLPLMGVGGAMGRGLISAIPRLSPIVGGSIGEGLVGGGLSAEQIRQDSKTGLITPKQSAMSVASGLGTGLFAVIGGRVAKQLGFADVDTMLASGKFTSSSANIPKAIVSGGLSEGVLEELPQSIQEQIWLNAAQDKPLLEGVPEGAAQGLVVGAVTGSGANVISTTRTTPEDILKSTTIDEAITKFQDATKVPEATEPNISLPAVNPQGGLLNEGIIKGQTDNQISSGRSAEYGIEDNGQRTDTRGNLADSTGAPGELGQSVTNENVVPNGGLINGIIPQIGNQAITETSPTPDTQGTTTALPPREETTPTPESGPDAIAKKLTQEEKETRDKENRIAKPLIQRRIEEGKPIRISTVQTGDGEISFSAQGSATNFLRLNPTKKEVKEAKMALADYELADTPQEKTEAKNRLSTAMSKAVDRAMVDENSPITKNTPDAIAKELDVDYKNSFDNNGVVTHEFRTKHDAPRNFGVEGEPTLEKVKAARDKMNTQWDKREAELAGKDPKIEWSTDDVETYFKKVNPEEKVGGLTVRKDVPNIPSIEASGLEYGDVDGIRVIKMSSFVLDEEPTPTDKATKKLAEEIKASGEINPLIVVFDSKGPYILEGSHRYDALKYLGVKEFPAMVVLDEDYGLPKTQIEKEPTLQNPKGIPKEAEYLGVSLGEHLYKDKDGTLLRTDKAPNKNTKQNGENNGEQARTVQYLVEHEKQSDASNIGQLSPVRGERNNDPPVADRVRGVPESYNEGNRPKADTETSTGQDGQQRTLRARESQVGNKTSTSEQQKNQQDVDSRRGGEDTGSVESYRTNGQINDKVQVASRGNRERSDNGTETPRDMAKGHAKNTITSSEKESAPKKGDSAPVQTASEPSASELTQKPTEQYKLTKWEGVQVGYGKGKNTRKSKGWLITEPDGNERIFDKRVDALSWVNEQGGDVVLPSGKVIKVKDVKLPPKGEKPVEKAKEAVEESGWLDKNLSEKQISHLDKIKSGLPEGTSMKVFRAPGVKGNRIFVRANDKTVFINEDGSGGVLDQKALSALNEKTEFGNREVVIEHHDDIVAEKEREVKSAESRKKLTEKKEKEKTGGWRERGLPSGPEYYYFDGKWGTWSDGVFKKATGRRKHSLNSDQIEEEYSRDRLEKINDYSGKDSAPEAPPEKTEVKPVKVEKINWKVPTRKDLDVEWETETMDSIWFSGYPKESEKVRYKKQFLDNADKFTSQEEINPEEIKSQLYESKTAEKLAENIKHMGKDVPAIDKSITSGTPVMPLFMREDGKLKIIGGRTRASLALMHEGTITGLVIDKQKMDEAFYPVKKEDFIEGGWGFSAFENKATRQEIIDYIEGRREEPPKLKHFEKKDATKEKQEIERIKEHLTYPGKPDAKTPKVEETPDESKIPESPEKKDLSTSSIEKIDKVRKLRPHVDEVKFNEISDNIIKGDYDALIEMDLPMTRTILGDFVAEGIVDQDVMMKYDVANQKASFDRQMNKLIDKYTGRFTNQLTVTSLEELKEAPLYVEIKDWLKSYKDTPKKVKEALAEEDAELERLAEPKLISEHKNYTLSESITKDILMRTDKYRNTVGKEWEPTDKIHIAKIDEADGPKKKKVEAVQRVVEDAVKRLKDTEADIKAVRFVLPDGTEYTVLNNKNALRAFKKLINKVYTPIRSTPAVSPKTSLKPKKRVQGWGEETFTLGEWVSDGHILVKGYKPPNRPAGKEGIITDVFILNSENAMKKASPAEIRYYTSGNNIDGGVVSDKPVLPMDEDIYGPYVIIKDTFTDKRFNYAQNKLNVIESVYPDVEYRISPDGVLYGVNDGELVAVGMPMVGDMQNEEMAKTYGLYSIGKFADTPMIMEMPEVIELAKELMGGKNPVLVDRFRKAGVMGQFIPAGTGTIKILRGLGVDFHQALKTIAHEIGHLVDYKDEGTMARGNILGRIASLKGYLKNYMEEKPGAPGPLTKDDRNRLMREARLLAKAEASQLIDEVITKEIPVTPDQVLAVLKGMETDPEPSPEVIHFIFTASTPVKKSIALQAMKGLTPKEMEHLKTYISEKTGKQIEQEDPTAKDVYKKFKELVKEEIAKRNLLSKEIITEELKMFTQLWKPFNVWGNPKYTKYRFSSVELYADALSGIITNPMMVQRVAPTFYKGFFDWIGQKPEASKLWGDIAKRIGRGPEAVSRERIRSDYEMFKRGEEARLALAKPEPERGFVDTLRVWLDDKNHFINKALREVEKDNPAKKDLARNARNQLKEIPYIPSEVDSYLYKINETIQKVMDKHGLTVHDLDVMALRKHIVANRTDIFSTKGYTPETAANDLKILKKDWGAEKYNQVDKLLDDLRTIRDNVIYPLMEESGLYTPELMKLMNETTDYTKVSVTHYLDKKFGKGTGARIFNQIGTLSEVNSPVTATIIQDISIIRAARVNNSKRSIIPLLYEAGAAEPAKMRYDVGLKKRVPAEPEDKDQKIFTVMVNGEAQHYYVSKHISDAYEFTPYEANAVAKAWNFLASGVRQMLISKNVVWMARNPFRDFRDTLKKNPEIKLRHSPKLLLEYKRAINEAFAEAWKKQRSESVEWLMSNRALTEDRVYDGRDTNIDTELHRLQSTFKLSTEADKNVGKFKKAWTFINRQLDNTGRAMEILSKIAGAKYLKKYTNLSDEEIFNRVRGGRIGTPDFKTRGSLHSLTNSLFMFSNIGKEGIKTHYRAARENTGDYIWKTLATNIVPKIILLGALKGLYDDKEDEDEVGYIQRIVEGIPEYNISHYTCIPLGLTEDGKSIWLQIPEDYEGQGFGAIAWKLMRQKFSGKGSAISELGNMQPYNLHPIAGAALDVKDIYISGINPVDDYMGRSKVSDNAMKIGGMELAEETSKSVWRDIGGKTIYNPPYDDIERKRNVYEELSKTWPLSAIGTFIQVSDRGVSEKIFDKFREIEVDKAKQSVAIDETLAKMSNEEKVMVSKIAPKLKKRVQKQLLLSENTAYSRALAAANTKEKIAIVLETMSKDPSLGK